MRWNRLIILAYLSFVDASVKADGSVSLEDLETIGAEMDSEALSRVKIFEKENQNEPPSSSGIGSNSASATDTIGLETIDIRSRIKKVSEPNLFAGAPPIPGAMRNMAPGEAPEEYTVREGDNLFDICDQLIDEASYWPKLWSFNPGISNPHFIYPGMKLRFYSGDSDNLPFLQVVSEDDFMPVDKSGIQEKDLVKEDISGLLMRSEIPDEKQVLDARDFSDVAGIDGMFIDVGQRQNPDKYTVVLPAFIVDEEFPVLGEIVGGSAGSFLVDRGQDLIIKSESELELQKGFTVVRRSGKVYSEDDSGFSGYRYEFIAQVKVSSKEAEQKYFRANVIYTRLGIEPGDLVIAYRSTKRSIPSKLPSAVAGENQQVVGFTEKSMEVEGRAGFIYLAQKDKKLTLNQVYAIKQNVKVSAPSFLRSELPDSDSKVANIYITDLLGSTAVGYILTNGLEVRLGDRISQ